MAQFVCPYDGEAFDQKSRYERHMASAHPPRAVSAADIEKALAGIDFPKSKQELVEYAARRVPPDSEVLRVIRALPDRIYRDAAEVAIAFGELKAPRSAHRGPAADNEEPPSRRGGRAAATEAVSAAAVAKILGGIDFPKTKAELREYAHRHQERVADPAAVVAVIDRQPDAKSAKVSRSPRGAEGPARAPGNRIAGAVDAAPARRAPRAWHPPCVSRAPWQTLFLRAPWRPILRCRGRLIKSSH